MFLKTDLETQSVSDVLAFFGIEIPREITRIGDGIANHSYIAKTNQGEYVVKFLVAQTTKNIENDIIIQKQLRRVGINTPLYIQNKDGRYIFNNNDTSAVVSERIDGVIPRKVMGKLAKDIGQKLAIFHKSVLKLSYPNNKGLMNPKVSGIVSELFAQSLPKGIIHGDLHNGNILVDPAEKDSVVAILDFEEAGENLYIVDLAVTLMSVCTSSDENIVDTDLMQAVTSGYESVRQLSKEEKYWLPEAIKYSAKAWIKWFNENGYDKYAEKHQMRLNSLNWKD
ncbi:MAG: Homoserine kinase [Candidatus Amesbacteria bacterium GW2011_GWA2_47_11b]|uniref:Homoserine kinase n=3 Tax=Candidatus Amesiibacteriota TaxID=1752730 RepID=A0A0G1UUL3_9BACT|nr:MAG: Homoserine kinase [Microgenomates group bacterium GW2011_GWC1_46_20]KKU57162.1 MAG: Homoserine kinase [Candidatus Amesbacteria bacterium GW2011_GWA2_47_11b]KKU69718.1 MAG: Homoserine kinase [Candidatus Amesbacteria bacterium GW2011_GWA1_47_20]KKU82913.1 MAG: Homoserine kinase [Candidatus Amesbacteria bacterium GW2011_GWC2_47_8]